jgi:hypothetical protein
MRSLIKYMYTLLLTYISLYLSINRTKARIETIHGFSVMGLLFNNSVHADNGNRHHNWLTLNLHGLVELTVF